MKAQPGAWPRLSSRLLAFAKRFRGFFLGPPPPPRVTAQPLPRPAREYGVGLLRPLAPRSSPRAGYRLNLVVPTVDAARTFGGIRTALEVFEAVGAGTSERRIVSLSAAGATRDDALAAYTRVEDGDDPDALLQLVALDGPVASLAVRADDVFLVTFWTTAEAIGRIRRWQASTYGSAPDRFAYLIQDYEPGFYPSSERSSLAAATYANASETIAIFNTSLLRDFFHASRITFDREFTFEPRLHPVLRRAMTLPPATRSRTIVIYGRPETPRNAFAAIIDGLVEWRARDSRAIDWRVVAVGQAHPDIDLGEGLVLESLGKLTIDAYAALLRESAIGISLMVSPHPSYPPLEMAHLGMLVLTNGFGGKDLSAWHTNIQSTNDLSAEAIAGRLSELCKAFEADPGVGDTGRPLRPDFIADAPSFPFAEQVAADLREGAARGAAASSASTDRPDALASD
jgi:hypothetical protein